LFTHATRGGADALSGFAERALLNTGSGKNRGNRSSGKQTRQCHRPRLLPNEIVGRFSSLLGHAPRAFHRRLGSFFGVFRR
jgi:hypothetical protein